MEIPPLNLFKIRSRLGTFEKLKWMNTGFVKRKLFNSVQPKETSIQGQSLRSRQIVWLCPGIFISLGWTESKRFCFTNPAFIHFSLSKVPKSGPCLKKVLPAHGHLIGLTRCIIIFFPKSSEILVWRHLSGKQKISGIPAKQSQIH